MAPTMPFPAVGPGPTSPLVLHGRFPPHFEVHKASAAQRFIVGPRWPQARQPNQYSRARSARWSDRRTSTTSFPMMGSMLPLISIPTVSATCHGDPPLTQAEELTKVYNMGIFNTTPEFMGVLAPGTDHLLNVGLLPPTHYISGGLSLDHRFLYAGMLESEGGRELGVTGPKAEAALMSMESCKHRNCSNDIIFVIPRA
ncbi:hypothetical protein EDB89DRAFT_2011355, partial [Lactarius sanguifluus]